MENRIRFVRLEAIACLLAVCFITFLTQAAEAKGASVTLPLVFQANQGQFQPFFRYAATTNRYDLFVSSDGASFALHPAKPRIQPLTVRMNFPGANATAQGAGLDEVPGKVNYIDGNSPADWHRSIPLFRKIRFRGIYPGVDLSYYGRDNQLEYDFEVAAGASPKLIRIRFEGLHRIHVSAEGDAVLTSDEGELRLKKPVAYQYIAGVRRVVPARYLVSNHQELRIRLGQYDRHLPLVIDPVLAFTTYLGGAGADGAGAAATDSAGNIYVAGATDSPDFPITPGAYQSNFGTQQACSLPSGSFPGDPYPCQRVFVAKLSADGSQLIYATFIGTSGTAYGIGVNASGEAYVIGSAGAGFPLVNPLMTAGNVFLLKLSADGSALVYSTLLNGFLNSQMMAVDAGGNAYVSGSFTTFPVLPPTPDSKCAENSAALTKLNPSGTGIVYSTCIGPPSGIALDNTGNAYVVGSVIAGVSIVTLNAAQPSFGGAFDAFVSKLDSSGSFVYSTYLGGSQADYGRTIAVDASGAAYVSGITQSSDFPTLNPIQPYAGAFDAFITKLDSSGRIVYSTYLGGSQNDSGAVLGVDDYGDPLVIVSGPSLDFPTGIMKINESGSAIVWSSPIPSGYLSVDKFGNLFVVGGTNVANLPGTSGTFQPVYHGGADPKNTGDAFVTKMVDVQSTAAYSVPAAGARPLLATSTAASTAIGYGTVQSGSGNALPDALAIMDFRQNGTLITEQTIPAAPPVSRGRIYAEMNGAVTTGLAFANPNNTATSVGFYLTDSNGNDTQLGSFTIGANGQIAAFLDQPPFSINTRSFQGTLTFQTSAPVAVVALRGFTNERSEFLSTTLPVSDPQNSIATPLLIPHFAYGGGWTTDILLVNTTDTAETGIIQFFDSGQSGLAGQPLTVTISGQQASSFPYSIPPTASTRLTASSLQTAIQTGSVLITPSSGNTTPAGLSVFSFQNAGITVAEAGVQTQQPSRAFSLYVEASSDIHQGASGTVQTGIALANPSSTEAVTVTLELLKLSGATTSFSTTVTLPARGHTAMFLNEIPGFASLPTPFQGVLRISTNSSAGVSVVGLRGRYNERQDFLVTTTAPVDESLPISGAQTVFPDLVVGGGYSSQIVLFSGHGQSATGTLSFYSQNGQVLNVSLH